MALHPRRLAVAGLTAALIGVVGCAPSSVGATRPDALGVSRRLGKQRPEPGRYATHVWSSGTRTCSGGWAHHDVTASAVLNIEPDGTVTACRGINRLWSAGSRLADVDERYRSQQQQGMSGRWRRKGAWLEMQLNRDDSVCAPVRSGVADDLDASWTLRCTALVGTDQVANDPVIGCRSVGSDLPSSAGLAVHDVLPGAWIIAAAGPGMQIVERVDHLAPSQATVQAATTRVEHDSWRTAAPR